MQSLYILYPVIVCMVLENLHLGRKTAMKFDLEKMFEETRRTAREYSEQITGESHLSLTHQALLLVPSPYLTIPRAICTLILVFIVPQ